MAYSQRLMIGKLIILVRVDLLNLIGGEFFTNQHSAGFDAKFFSDDHALAHAVTAQMPYVILSTEINLFYDTERRNALATNRDEYLRWLEWRDELFRDIPLSFYRKSIIKPDAWLLMCDFPQTDREERLIQELSQLGEKIHVVVGDFRNASSDAERHYSLKPGLIRAWISNNLEEYNLRNGLITTRLDSDDALSETYFYDLQKFFFLAKEVGKKNIPQKLLCNFPIGCQIAKQHVASNIFGENCFTSLFEQSKTGGCWNTVWSFPHDRVPLEISLCNLITQKPAWYQGIHSRNVVNQRLTGGFTLRSDNIPHEFLGIYSGAKVSA